VNILITGGAGFIGSNIAVKLVTEGNNVTVADNFHSGSVSNLQAIKDKIKILNCESGACEKFTDNYDVIFHKGVYSSTPMYKENPLRVGMVINDFINILEFARKQETRIVWASTSSLYNDLRPPHKENMRIKVTDFYTEARFAMERLAELYNKLYGVRSMALRYFSVYGPGETAKKTYANLISQFFWAIRDNESPVIYGNGKQTRDFTYIDDVIDANMLAMKSSIKFGIYNVGTGVETSINNMVHLLNKKMHKNLKPKYVENKISNYVFRIRADTAKAEKELGFKAKVDLEQGIERLIRFY